MSIRINSPVYYAHSSYNTPQEVTVRDQGEWFYLGPYILEVEIEGNIYFLENYSLGLRNYYGQYQEPYHPFFRSPPFHKVESIPYNLPKGSIITPETMNFSVSLSCNMPVVIPLETKLIIKKGFYLVMDKSFHGFFSPVTKEAILKAIWKRY